MTQEKTRRSGWRTRFILLVALISLPGPRGVLEGATYLPLSDTDLALRSPLIVRARVIDQELRLESVEGSERVYTLTSFDTLEVLKGRMDRAAFRLELPGGRLGDVANWFPGTPSFRVGGEALLFLAPVRWRESDVSLTEFGLSKFDVVEDANHRRFLVRPVFSPEEDDEVSQRAPVALERAVPASSPRFRDAESFLAGLKALIERGEIRQTEYAEPSGELRPAGIAIQPLWVNIGGVEGVSNLFRWFWDTGQSANAIVTVTGAQTGLTDGSNGMTHVQNAITQWTSVAATSVHYSFSSGTAPVVIRLDVDSNPPTWMDALPCSQGGVLGLGGPGNSFGPRTFKGDGNYFAASAGDVWMRKITGGCYAAAIFRAGVLHETGHTLGLGHPDQAVSNHSTTTAADWNEAVMHSVVPASRPDTPQTDDIQAMQYYYGTGVAQPCGRGTPSCGNPIIRVPDVADSPLVPGLARRR